jgi:uncharacterized membrane protein
MKRISRHVTQCTIAGIVALLPVGGLIITIGYVESKISSSGLSKLPFYFPGFGLLVTAILIYLIGLGITTFLGKWLYAHIDSLLDRLPALGRLYQTLKQILGYGVGKDTVFREVVLIPSRDSQSEELGLVTKELGLVTNKISDEAGRTKLLVFVPGAPNPTTGRLVIVNQEFVKPLAMPVNETLKALVSVGKAEIDLRSMKTPE